MQRATLRKLDMVTLGVVLRGQETGGYHFDVTMLDKRFGNQQLFFGHAQSKKKAWGKIAKKLKRTFRGNAQ